MPYLWPVSYTHLLDEAIERLPVDVASGRISKGAAYALKAEVCLQGAAYLDDTNEKRDYYTQAKTDSESLFGLNKYSLDPDFKGLFNDYSVGTNSSEIILGVYNISENTSFQNTWTVSYTHLDVYKRQSPSCC